MSMAEPEINLRQPHKPDEQWLALVQEDIIDPSQPIIDPHHHLMQRGDVRYFMDEFLADLSSGHNVRATVFIECGAMWRANGPPMMAPLGEVEFANGVAAMSASGTFGPTCLCAGIVGSADFSLGEKIEALLDAQLAAAPEHFRGIRISAAWDADKRLQTGRITSPPLMLRDKIFQAAFAKLAPRKLSFEAWAFHPQLDDVLDLAQAFPDTVIIINHMGGLLARWGDYAADRQLAVENWRAVVKRLAACPNLYMKLGGLGMPFLGYGFSGGAVPPTSGQLATEWGPEMRECIDAFGPARCMFESNFPPDKQSCSYAVLWNAFKKIAAQYTPDERHALLYGTAKSAYRLTD